MGERDPVRRDESQLGLSQGALKLPDIPLSFAINP